MTPGSTPASEKATASQEINPRRRFPWLKAFALTGGVVVAGGAALAFWGWNLVEARLPGFLEENLSEALGRPLKLGEFERFSIRGIRFGPSILPPTATNFTWAKAQSVDISFNPLELVFKRTLRPSVVFLEPEVAIKQGFNQEWAVEAPNSAEESGLIKTQLKQLQVRNAKLAIGPVTRRSIIPAPEGVVSAALIVLENVNLRVGFSGADNKDSAFVLGGRINNGAFQLRGGGRLGSGEFKLALQGQQLPVASINPLLGGTLFIKDGLFSCNLDVDIQAQAKEWEERISVRGNARLRNGEVIITDLPSPISDINGTLLLKAQTATLENSSLKYGPIFVEARGQVSPQEGYDLAVEIPDVSLAEVETAFAQELPVVASGVFDVATAITGPLLDPQVKGQLKNQGVVQVDRLGLDAIAAQFSANKTGVFLDALRVNPQTGGLITAQGQVDFRQDLTRPDLNFTAQTDLPLDPLAQLYEIPVPGNLRLGPLVANAQVLGKPDDFRATAQWALPRATFPGKGQLTFANNLLQAQNAQFQVGTGTLTANAEANLNTQGWQASVQGSALPLTEVSPQLRGTLDATVRASGRLTALTLADTQAVGQVRLSQAIPLDLEGAEELMPGPLTAAFAWTGDELQVPEVRAPNLFAQGYADVAIAAGGLPEVTGFNFDANLTNFNLGTAYGLLDAPDWISLQGFLDFDGTLQGTFADPRIAGTLELRQFAINDFALLSSVSGPVQASLTQGSRINLQGGDTTIFADIAPNFLPNAFRLTNGAFVAEGQRTDNLLNASIRNFDIAALQFHPVPAPDLGVVGGILNGNAQVDLTDLFDPDVVARVAIARPALGAIAAESFTARFQYGNGAALLTNGVLSLTPRTQFQLAASGRLFPEWQVTAQVSTQNAQIQDILSIAQIYSFDDLSSPFSPKTLGRARDLQTVPIGDPTASLEAQANLARTSRSEQERAIAQKASLLIPDLDQLDGTFSGSLTASAGQRQSIQANFDFGGQGWVWGRYDFDNQFTARGSLVDQRLTLNPLEFRAEETLLSLAGEVSPAGPNLTFQAQGLPLSAAAELVAIPIEVMGELNLAAQLSGSFGNPQLVGQLAVDEPQVNQQPLQEISSTFQYQEAIFRVDGRVQATSPEPLLFSGTVPYALPFMTVQPATNQIDLRASLKDEGFALVNLFTPVIQWGGGQARMDIQIGGTLREPLVNGVLAFQDAIFASPYLNTSLTALQGEMRFTGDLLQVDRLQGELMEGQFVLQGSLPIRRPETPQDEFLQLDLETLNFNFANEVTSQIDGQIFISDAVIHPVIGGEIALQNTQIKVGPEVIQLANYALIDPGIESVRANFSDIPAQFKDFHILLGSTAVQSPPLFALDLTGDVTLDGPLGDVSAEGDILLEDAWINTITTEFILQKGRKNRATFFPEQKLDPYLDLEFTAVVPLQRQYDLRPSGGTVGNTSEIPDLDVLASTTIFDEIQVHAQVKGPASRLFDNLTLSSNPSRSQQELLGMVSGGYLSDLDGAEPSLALASNLLSALGSGVQDDVAQALGIERFRLTASTVLPAEEGDTLGYGVGLNPGCLTQVPQMAEIRNVASRVSGDMSGSQG